MQIGETKSSSNHHALKQQRRGSGKRFPNESLPTLPVQMFPYRCSHLSSFEGKWEEEEGGRNDLSLRSVVLSDLNL